MSGELMVLPPNHVLAKVEDSTAVSERPRDDGHWREEYNGFILVREVRMDIDHRGAHVNVVLLADGPRGWAFVRRLQELMASGASL